jgi:flagellar biosynthesis protein FliR
MDYSAIRLHDLYVFVLLFARVSGLMVAAPILGNRSIPRPVKAGLALIFSLAVLPMTAPKVGAIPDHLYLLAGQVLGDVIFGLSLGYLARLLFSAIEMAGYFVDTQMGFGMVNLYDPFAEQQTSVLSVFQYQLALTVYLLSNGHLLLLGALAESFNVLLPGGVSLNAGFGMTAVPMLQLMFALGFRLALPAAGVLFVVDFAFGLIARLVPQVNVFIVGVPAKIIIGLATVTILLPSLSLIVGQIIMGTTEALNALILSAK